MIGEGGISEGCDIILGGGLDFDLPGSVTVNEVRKCLQITCTAMIPYLGSSEQLQSILNRTHTKVSVYTGYTLTLDSLSHHDQHTAWSGTYSQPTHTHK